MVGVNKFDSYMEKPTKLQLEYIKNQINEDEKKVVHLQELIDKWIECEPFFPKSYEKNLIKHFIRGSKHNLDKTKNKVECNFAARTCYKEYFDYKNVTSNEICSVLEASNIVALPKLTEEGNRIWILSNITDANSFDMKASTKIFFMIYDLILSYDYLTSGEELIIDLKGSTPGHIVKFISHLKTLVVILRRAYAVRLRKIHIVNVPALFEKVLNPLKPLLHKKVRNNILLHSDPESLHKYISPSVLPKNYGGELEDIRVYTNFFKNVLIDNTEIFQIYDKSKLSGSLSEKMKNTLEYGDEFGVQGSFRKLEID